MLRFVVLILSVYILNAALVLQHVDNPQAVCNDGSPAGFYYRNGTNPHKWIIYLEGGGFCYDNQSCQLRWQSSPSLMSSKQWGSTKTGSGILSEDATENKYWHDASVLDIEYCSSDSHSGNKMKSDITWNFMGSVIVESVVDQAIKKLGLSSATQVIFSGSSAGAEGLYPNANRVAKMLGEKTQFLVLLDSGWFLDFEPLHEGGCKELTQCTEQEGLKRGVLHWNPRMNEECATQKAPEIWQCLLGYHAFPFLSAPSFVFVYSYDAAGLGHNGIYHIPSSQQELTYANEAATNISLTLHLAGVSAYYNPTCYYHTIELDNNWNKVLINGKSYVDVAYEWTLNPTVSVAYRDTCVGPNCNPTCKYL